MAKEKNTLQTIAHMMRADIMPATLNKDARTVEVTFATDQPVLTVGRVNDWNPFYEVLSFEAGHIRTDRIMSGAAPVLDNHDKYAKVTSGAVLGVVENARFDSAGKKGTATLRFSKRASLDEVFQDIEDKILQNVSVGYRVHKYRAESAGDGVAYPTYVAIDWEPTEISMATMPADFNARTRTDEPVFETELEVIEQKRGNNTDMTEAEKKAIADAERQRAADITKAVADAGLPAEFARTLIEQEATTVEAARTAISAEKARISNDPSKAKEEGKIAERTRVSEINKAVKAAKLSDEFARTLIEDGVEIDVARQRIIDEFAKADPSKGTHTPAKVGVEERDKIRTGMEDALVHRADPSQKLTDSGREFRGMDLMDMARFAVEKAGGSIRGLSKREVALAALNIDGARAAGMHSTSDFPNVLGNTVNRTLRNAYEMYPQTFKPFTKQSSNKDFREKSLAQIGDLTSKFKEIKEGGEYTYGTLGEAKESYKLAKYGQIIAITWETLINDDLGAFNRTSQSIGMKAAQLESDLVWAIITGNPNMGDGTALFHADHGNLAGAGTVIDIANLAKAKAAMRKQKSIGKDFLNITPSFLIVGPDKELEAYQFATANIVANDQTKVNPFAGGLQVIVEPRLTGNQWYLSAAPGVIDTIEYAYLEGEQGLFTEQRNGFEVDGLEIKARLVFGCKAIDWRGLYKNAGA